MKYKIIFTVQKLDYHTSQITKETLNKIAVHKVSGDWHNANFLLNAVKGIDKPTIYIQGCSYQLIYNFITLTSWDIYYDLNRIVV